MLAARGKGHISILGLWKPSKWLKYALANGSFKAQCYIKVIDSIAGRAY